jgi:hypothetical protein
MTDLAVRPRAVVTAVLVAAVLACALGAWVLAAPKSARPAATAAVEQVRLRPDPGSVKSCVTSATRPFTPVSAVLRDGQVIQMYAAAREPGGIVPGVAPLTDWGKNVFAWDAPGVLPGSTSGVVVLDAHSWPDGSALGNWLMTNLKVGQTLILSGSINQRQCYRIASQKVYPALDVPWKQTYGPYPPGAPARLTITICYWPRLGPENWANREVWVAEPY